MKRFLSFFILALAVLGIRASETAENSNKVKFKFGGRLDASVFTDSYASKAKNGGLFYYFPLAPSYNKYGDDLNAENSLRFGIANTRLSGTLLVPELLGAEGKVFVETDFMGTNDNTFGLFRLRHAYIGLNWQKSWLLIGQTNNLSVPEEIFPNTVSHGCGTPIDPLSRIVQIRYGHLLAPQVRLTAAVGMYGGTEGTAQSYGMIPDIQLKLTIGNTSGTFIGMTGGFKSIRPRNLTADSVKTHQRMTAFSASVFGQHIFGGGHKLTAFAMWGQDLSTLNMLGGYAPLLKDTRAGDLDYGYTATRTVAAWVDFETKVMKGWQPGIFAGWTKNLGTGRDIDLAKASITDQGIDWYLRLAPRLWYHYKKLSFGVEYMYSLASWGKAFDARYRPTERYANTHNNRVTLLARYKF